MSKIKSIKAREILDSRGNPTVEVELRTDKFRVVDSVPAGASKGKTEAKELRDGGKRYLGLGVKKAVRNVNQIIAPKLINLNPERQEKIDQIMIKLDGTKSKSRLGANAILGVSLAVCRAGAVSRNIPLWKYISDLNQTPRRIKVPQPLFNILNGGVHAGNHLSVQEFMIAPKASKFSNQLRMASEIYHTLKSILKKEMGPSAINVGDEGGFAPDLSLTSQALDYIKKAIKKSGYKGRVMIFLDVAASQIYKSKLYLMDGHNKNRNELLDYYRNLVKDYPIIRGIEDPFDEEEWKYFQIINKKLGRKIYIIGDDLLTSNPVRIKKAGGMKACNTLLLKPNQIGTISEAIEAGRLARSYGWSILTSHRSGETDDGFIADFATGINSNFIKAGAPARGERVAKYNRLLGVEKEIKR